MGKQQGFCCPNATRRKEVGCGFRERTALLPLIACTAPQARVLAVPALVRGHPAVGPFTCAEVLQECQPLCHRPSTKSCPAGALGHTTALQLPVSSPVKTSSLTSQLNPFGASTLQASVSLKRSFMASEFLTQVFSQ